MSFIKVVLYKVYMSGITIGTTVGDHEIITSIQYPGRPRLNFRYFGMPGRGYSGKPLKPEVIMLPEQLAQKLYTFCKETFVQGQSDFNCYIFVHYILGWDNQIKTGCSFTYKGFPERPTSKLPYTPYYVVASNLKSSHAFLSMAKKGLALNVLGTDAPLAITPITDLLKIFDGDFFARVSGWGKSIAL